jgi:hypothetical protein
VTITQAMPAGFRIRVVDGTSAAQFAYSIDGAAYVNSTGITYTASGTVKTTADVATPVVSTLAIRAANAAGTAAQVYFQEVEPIETDVAQFINAARDSAVSTEMSRSTHAPLDAWLTLHTEVNLVVVAFTNNVAAGVWDRTAFRASLDNLLTRCVAIGADLLPLVWFQRGSPPFTLYPSANQDELREEARDFASDNSLPIIDLRDFYPTSDDSFGASLVMDELGARVHGTSAGLDFVADKIWRQINRNAATAGFVRV